MGLREVSTPISILIYFENQKYKYIQQFGQIHFAFCIFSLLLQGNKNLNKQRCCRHILKLNRLNWHEKLLEKLSPQQGCGLAIVEQSFNLSGLDFQQCIYQLADPGLGWHHFAAVHTATQQRRRAVWENCEQTTAPAAAPPQRLACCFNDSLSSLPID